MIDHTGVHSYAMFRGTEDCPVKRPLEGCLDGCLHAKECFAKFDDPDEAMKALENEYCDTCVFASMEED